MISDADADAARPIHAAVTAARVDDIAAAKAMPIEAGASYVFDLGHDDYAWWAALDAAGCCIENASTARAIPSQRHPGRQTKWCSKGTDS